MKKELLKKENIFYFGIFMLLLIVHFPLLTKTILTADVLLNNQFYNGYSWEISLGRFGLWVVGFLKSYLSIPSIEYFISFVLITIITYILMQIFEVKDKFSKTFSILLMVLSPVVSATLLFHYCSVAYLLAFLCGLLSVVLYYRIKNKWLKYLLPIGLIVISLSMYQAYLSLIITVFVLYQIKLLLDSKMDYKNSLKYILCLFAGILIYFIGMKLSLLVFHIDMASYSNANSIGIHTLLSFPQKVVDSYKLFYEFFFTNTFMKNHYMGNTILNLLILILFVVTFFYQLFKSKINNIQKIIIVLLLLLMPIFLNSVIFVISDSKLQLLMSASYLVFFFYIISFSYPKWGKVILTILLICLFRNYLIQDEASYITLDQTYKTYDTIIHSAIQNNINHLDKKFVVIGDIKNRDKTITNKNYGYIVDDGIFWEEYNLRKLGFERFCKQTYGLELEFADEDSYQEVLNHTNHELIYEYNDIIVINLYNY